MPAFDPVRDAVLNSPVSTHPPLPSPFTPTTASSSSPFPSPSLSRRATDLSVLLNNDQSSDQSPKSASYIDQDRLGHSAPFRRSSLPQTPSKDVIDISSPSIQPPKPAPIHSPSRSPAVSTATSRPSSSSSSNHNPHFLQTPRTTVSPTMPPPPLPSSTIPYNPTRKTPAKSVLVPLSQEEIIRYKSYRGAGTLRLTKRKRTFSTEAENQPPAKRFAGDVGVIQDHCSSSFRVCINNVTHLNTLTQTTRGQKLASHKDKNHPSWVLKISTTGSNPFSYPASPIPY
jgi:mRNA (guanine-N7-)-methyltransferase